MGKLGSKRVTCSGSSARKWGLGLTPGGGMTLRPACDALTAPEGGVKADAGKDDVKSRDGMNEPFPTPLPPSVMSMISLLLASSLMVDDLCGLACDLWTLKPGCPASLPSISLGSTDYGITVAWELVGLCIASPPTPWPSPPATPTLPHHSHPESVVYMGLHSWCCQFLWVLTNG